MDALPPNALLHLPVLRSEVEAHWPYVPRRSYLAAQIEQETCYSLRSQKCWSPYAELKTAREYGFGLGQITVTERFDNFAAARKLHPSMKDWQWSNRYDARFQIRTLVLMNRFNFGKADWAANERERMAFTLSAYNGGLGGVLSDRAVCRQNADCDPSRWFGHVEHTSRKAKVAVKGYGKSFFQINREYVRNVMLTRPHKYTSYFEEVIYVGPSDELRGCRLTSDPDCR